MLHYHRFHWFPFCPSDWTAKVISAGLSVPAEGCLIALLCIQWQEGSIPLDTALLKRCLRGYDGPALREALALFVRCPNDASRQYHPPLEAARQETILAHRKRVEAGRKGAIKTNGRFEMTVRN